MVHIKIQWTLRNRITDNIINHVVELNILAGKESFPITLYHNASLK